MPLDLEFVRAQFPALESGWIYLDNAGGSQVLSAVTDRITDYLLNTNVQHGASYALSAESTARIREAQRRIATLINAGRPEEVVMGASSTLLLGQLASAMRDRIAPGDEVIVTDVDHEANIGPWRALAEHGVEIKAWRLDPHTLELDLAALERLLTPRTKLVCVTHASNVLGTINPIEDIVRLVHGKGAKVCVDGVAYAPHRIIDVSAWDVDYYVFSLYKVYGPHHAVLYGKYEDLLGLRSLNHFFVAEDDIPYKFQPGNVNYELSYGSVAVVDYLEQLGRHQGAQEDQTRPCLEAAFAAIAAHEAELSERLLAYLRVESRVRIIGRPEADQTLRLPTISFVVRDVDSAALVAQIDPHRIGIRYGDFYARRLIEALGLAKQNGVVRVSMVHYNRTEEIDRLIECLRPLV